MLFIIAMDTLQRMLDLATQQGVLTPLPLTTARWKTSIYAYNTAILINLVKEDMEAVGTILQAFGGFSGLYINM
jgi:hypothetical protein